VPPDSLVAPDSKASWKDVGLYGVRIFSVSENGYNGLGDEGADGAMHPRIFLARTAPCLPVGFSVCYALLYRIAVACRLRLKPWPLLCTKIVSLRFQ